MGSPISPILSGLLGGFQLAHQIKGERIAQETFERQKRRDEEDLAVRDLQTQMSLGAHGYKPSTPEQDAEIASGYTMGPASAPDPNAPEGGMTAGPPSLVPSDIKTRIAKFKGQTYVRPSDAELDRDSEIATKRELARKLTETQALGDAENFRKLKLIKDTLEETGFKVDEEMSKTLHIKPGQKIRPENIDDLMRSFTSAKNAERLAAPHAVGVAREVTDDNGNVTSVQTYSDGTVKQAPLGAIGKKTKPAAGRAPGSMTPWQDAQLKRQTALDAKKAEDARVKAQNDAQSQINKLNGQEQLLHAENREIGQRLLAGSAGTATNKKGGKVKVTEADAGALKARLADNQNKVKALQQQQHDIIMRFAGAGQAAAAGAGAGLSNPY